MTCADDMLNAFAGILATLQPSFPHGFIQGLPEFFFDVALLWRRFESKSARRARKPFRRCLEPGKMWASKRFASWSWVGWEDCRVQWPLLYNDAVDWEMQVIPISPVTSWLKLGERNTLSAVHNDYLSIAIPSRKTPIIPNSRKAGHATPKPPTTKHHHLHLPPSSRTLSPPA
jgi:hypothetical protein